MPEVPSEIGPHQVIATIDIKLAQQISRSPLCVLDMKDSQHGLAVAFRFVVEPAEGIEGVEFLRGNFPDGGLACICVNPLVSASSIFFVQDDKLCVCCLVYARK